MQFSGFKIVGHALLAGLLVSALGLAAVSGAQAYIGEGVQGRPHGGAKAAVRYYNFRHGYGYTRHVSPRHYRRY